MLGCGEDKNGESPWVNAIDPADEVDVDLSLSPTLPLLIATFQYNGPPLAICSQPSISVVNDQD